MNPISITNMITYGRHARTAIRDGRVAYNREPGRVYVQLCEGNQVSIYRFNGSDLPESESQTELYHGELNSIHSQFMPSACLADEVTIEACGPNYAIVRHVGGQEDTDHNGCGAMAYVRPTGKVVLYNRHVH